MFGDDADREQFFDAARMQAENDFAADDTNVMALIRWGGALLELAHFRQGQDSVDMIEKAIVKLRQALVIDTERPDAEWCLGNAYTSLGFLQSDKPKALVEFGRAAGCFKRCQQQDPTNDTYKKALEMCDKAPEYYDDIQMHIKAQQMSGGGGGEAAGGGGGERKAGGNDFWWDVAGWAVLVMAVGTALTFMRAAPPPGGARA